MTETHTTAKMAIFIDHLQGIYIDRQLMLLTFVSMAGNTFICVSIYFDVTISVRKKFSFTHAFLYKDYEVNGKSVV